MPGSLLLRGLLAATLVSSLSPRLAAAASLFPAPGDGSALEAGRRVELRWSRLPRGVEEAELLFSCNGGRTFARVADLEPSAVAYAWDVPSLPTADAVLAIRGRVDDEETLLLRTPTFVVAESASPRLGPLSYHGGELWTDPDGGSAPVGGDGLAAPAPRDALGACPGNDPLEDDPALVLDGPPESPFETTCAVPVVPNGAAPGPRSPLSIPRRE